MHIIDMKKEAQEIVHKPDPYLALILSPFPNQKSAN